MSIPSQLYGIVGAIAVCPLAMESQAGAEDLAAAKAQFLTSCGTCHVAEEGAPKRQGPNLWGVYGRKAGTRPGFAYSPVLTAGGWTWDEAKLDP